MLPGIIEIILAREDNALKFEKFCADIMEKAEGIPFVTTSRSYDRGRDAIGLGRSKGSQVNVLLCTLSEKDLVTKVRSDAEVLARNATPDRVEYCYSKPLSQAKTDELKAILRKIFPKASVAVLGAEALAQIAAKSDAILDKHYGPELRAIRSVSETKGISADKKGLVLALHAFSSEDAQQLRKQISGAAVLNVISAFGAATDDAIAAQLSIDLQLPKQLNSEFIAVITKECESSGLIERSAGKWILTSSGTKHSAAMTTEAAEQLLAGRTIIRKKLEGSIGKPIPDSHFERIWSTLQDFFAQLFYTNGLSTICAVNEVLSGTASVKANKGNLRALIAEGAAQVRATTGVTDLGEELEQAVLDIFTERTGDAFEWLARVAERFVALCSLGLEATTVEEIRNILGRYRLLLDSDIILTYLCEGEPDHEAAKELLDRWLKLGGEILLAPPVMQEVAAHAWISDRTFPDTVHLLGHLTEEELPHYTSNAFVRAFHVHAKSSADRDKWRTFIQQYQGQSAEDYSKMIEILIDELRAKVLSTGFDAELARAISDFLKERLARRKKVSVTVLDDEIIGKSNRDGELLAMSARARQLDRESHSDKTVVVISSSTRLRSADDRFRAQMGNPEGVISLSALSYLLSMLPDNPLGAGALRRALFEFTLKPWPHEAERIALQIIKSAGTYEVPLARRITLRHEVEKSIRREAERRGVNKDILERDFERHKPAVPYADIIGDAVRNMAANIPELEEAGETIRQLKKKIQELEQADEAVRRSARQHR